MNPIFQGLQQGYTPQQILQFLSKIMPQMSPAISKATKSGYTPKQILGFFSKNFDTEDRRGMSESERHGANRRADEERAKHGLKIAATAVAAPVAASVVSNALSRALPNALGNLPTGTAAGGVGLNAQQNIPTAAAGSSPANLQLPLGQASQTTPTTNPTQNLSQQPPINQVAPSLPQQAQPTQAKGIADTLWQSIQNGKLTDRDPNVSAFMKVANSLRKTRGLSSKEDFDKLYSAFENKRKMGLEGPELARELFAEWEGMQEEKQAATEMQPKPAESAGIAKGSTVASPQGVGEIKEIRNGKAIIDVDGKKHQVNEDELIESPLPEKDLADLFDDMISGIEKETGQEVSRNVEWAGYDPNTNELIYKPHGSDKVYAYDEISPEDVEQLTSLLNQRKSTGGNFIGAWQAGTKSPIGAAMYQLIKKLQSERGGKGNEYKNRFETVYDAFEPAKLASKKKHAERKKKAKKSGLA